MAGFKFGFAMLIMFQLFHPQNLCTSKLTEKTNKSRYKVIMYYKNGIFTPNTMLLTTDQNILTKISNVVLNLKFNLKIKNRTV